ncbi:MarR family winged helix-turn-helix transcriptional regulator [Clostridium thermarum]|uniref:MarR family winged helix-turn-helix transcriptional regulator n=1 Tax=Clostridium thermarum TaxID=1716543 RepID=UPI0013D68C8D|nr:MarR family transcriptional regulator [Clostridium thermarum]
MEGKNKGIIVVKTIKRVMHYIKHNLEHHFKGINLTAPQGMLIGILAKHGEMKVSDLSVELGLSNSTVSGIIDRLEKQGLVERTRSEEDRRVVYVSVTKETKKNTEEHFKCVEREFEAMVSEATPEELDEILKGLAVLERVLHRKQEKWEVEQNKIKQKE